MIDFGIAISAKIKSAAEHLLVLLPLTVTHANRSGDHRVNLMELLKILFIPIIVGILSAWVTVAKFETAFEYHKSNNGIHMEIDDKIEKFVTRREYRDSIDRLDAYQNNLNVKIDKIIEKLK